MTEDQRYILSQLVALAESEAVDVILIAGDLYDRQLPPSEAVQLLNEVITRLTVQLGVKVIAIAGNHDSAERLDFGQQLLQSHGFYIRGQLTSECAPILLSDSYGPVHIYPIPFAEPAVARAVFENDAIRTHGEALKEATDRIRMQMNTDIRNICLSHAFVIGENLPETSESERQLSAVGGAEYVPANVYEGFDYVALGHLHRPQHIGADHIRYAGSLLKYSFSEVMHQKSVSIITLGEKGDVAIQLKPLLPLRDMRHIEGSLEELCQGTRANTDDYIHVTLTDSGALYEPLKKLRAYYPNILQLERQNFSTKEATQKLTTQQLKQKGPRELFSAFYEEVVGTIPEKPMETLFDEMFEKALKGDGGVE
jgi:exonuclease SbcD